MVGAKVVTHFMGCKDVFRWTPCETLRDPIAIALGTGDTFPGNSHSTPIHVLTGPHVGHVVVYVAEVAVPIPVNSCSMAEGAVEM